VIELLLNQRPRRLGSFEVGRVLPATKRRMIGPFIFFDHLGRAIFLFPAVWKLTMAQSHRRRWWFLALTPDAVVEATTSSVLMLLGRRTNGRAVHLMEFCVVFARAHRPSKSGSERR
jgi:hypothetical protein